jgi:hypothetical protein
LNFTLYLYFISRELVGPGGFLDLQTTDTQFFGDSQSMHRQSDHNQIAFGIQGNNFTFVPYDDSSETSDSNPATG